MSSSASIPSAQSAAHTPVPDLTSSDGVKPLPAAPPGLSADQIIALDDILDDLRTRFDETPQWEFCDGFLAALVCCTRQVQLAEYLPVLLGVDGAPGEDAQANPDSGSFASEAQYQQFLDLWHMRWQEVETQLHADVQSLNEEGVYQPHAMDLRGAIAALPPQDRATLDATSAPALAQIWALGFMYVVESWPEDWEAPANKKQAKWFDECLSKIVLLTEDDLAPPTLAVHDESGPPSVSQQRMEDLAEAVWALYGLHDLRALQLQRQTPFVSAKPPGRNEPCYCGSGKKYKKCHGE